MAGLIGSHKQQAAEDSQELIENEAMENPDGLREASGSFRIEESSAHRQQAQRQPQAQREPPLVQSQQQAQQEPPLVQSQQQAQQEPPLVQSQQQAQQEPPLLQSQQQAQAPGREPARDVEANIRLQKKSFQRLMACLLTLICFLAIIAIGAAALGGVAVWQVRTMQAQTQGGVTGAQQQATVYTRWGNSTCPSTPGTEQVYVGLMAGHRTGNGSAGGTNFQCMPEKEVEYTLPHQPGIQGDNIIYGTEYSTSINTDSNNHNVPCAVCLTRGQTVTKMIPARTSCPRGWTTEYYGYLMAQKNDYSTYECVDRGMEIVPGTVDKDNVAILAHVEANCEGLHCSPYMSGKELNCVVCTM